METDKNKYLEEILTIIDKLPPMPDNILKLRKICADPNATFKDIVPILEKDAGFCADILHMANSAYYGVSHQVESISEAVRYIGFESVVDFVAVSFSNNVIKSHFSKIDNIYEYFKHSNEIGLATKCLAKAARKSLKDQEFFTVAGLLHDIGRLIILMVSDKEMIKSIGNGWRYKEDTASKETDLLGINHCSVGKQICEKWKFSDQLQAAVLKHHSPLKGEYSDAAAYILLAHFISMDDFPIEQAYCLYPKEALCRMGLTEKNINQARTMYLEKI